MKKTTETHFWHLNQVEKIKYDQSMVKVSHNLLQMKERKDSIIIDRLDPQLLIFKKPLIENPTYLHF